MLFVINNGEKQSERFQLFVDLCCQAFNILRKNANLFLNLFALVRSTLFYFDSMLYMYIYTPYQFAQENM